MQHEKNDWFYSLLDCSRDAAYASVFHQQACRIDYLCIAVADWLQFLLLRLNAIGQSVLMPKFTGHWLAAWESGIVYEGVGK